MATSSNGLQAPQEECSWLSGGPGFIRHPTALGLGLTGLQGSRGRVSSPVQPAEGLRLDRLPGGNFQRHRLYSHTLRLHSYTDTWISKGARKRALVILPAHPRKPGQAWQHQSFRVSLSALSKGTAVATGLWVPGEQACLPSQSQLCPGSERITLKLRQGRGRMDTRDVGTGGGAPQMSRPEDQRVSMGSRTGCRWNCTCPTFWSFQVQRPKKQRSPFLSPDLRWPGERGLRHGR